MKTFPNVGDQLYLRQFTGDYYVDQVKRPYTVISVSPKAVMVQSCKLHYPVFKYTEDMDPYYKKFDGKEVCFYDTVAESMEPDPNGRIEKLTWHPKREMWGTSDSYPEYAIFGKYEHFPYLN